MVRIYVKPRKGIRIINNKTMQPLPPEGKEVVDSQYWRRREKDGDVVITDEATAEKVVKPKKKEVIVNGHRLQ